MGNTFSEFTLALHREEPLPIGPIRPAYGVSPSPK